MIVLLIGYAIGTAQILAIEWFRQRSRHRSDLRVLRAELRRAASYDVRFAIDDASALDRRTAPRPPNVSSRFGDFVTQTAFHLTDLHDDVRTQEALLGILDACAMFRSTLDGFDARAAELRRTDAPARRSELLEDLRGFARDYDRRLEAFLPLLDTLIADVDERLQLASTWRQLNRPLGRVAAPATVVRPV